MVTSAARGPTSEHVHGRDYYIIISCLLAAGVHIKSSTTVVLRLALINQRRIVAITISAPRDCRQSAREITRARYRARARKKRRD